MRFVFPVKISRSCSFARISLSRRVLSTCFRTSVCVASLTATPYRAVAQAETADVHEMRSTALPATRPLESSANRFQGHTNPSFLGSGHAPERVHLLPLAVKTSCSLGGEIIAPCTSSRSVQVSSQFSVAFTFTNNTLDPLNLSPSKTTLGILSSCSFSPTSISVPSHQSKPFTLTCTGASDGTGTLTVTTDEVAATVAVTVTSLSVTPKGTPITVLPSTLTRQVFTVQNLGANTDTVDAITSCATYSCTLQTPTPIVVPAHSSKPDTVQFTSGAVGSSGTVGLQGTVRHAGSVDIGTVLASVPSPIAPVALLTPHNGDNHLVGLCVASCFDVMSSYSTPSYTSMDTPRSATLVYSSAQAHPMGLITVDVTDGSVRHSQQFSLQLRQANGSAVTFTNGTTELFFKQDSAAATRLTGQFDATSLGTGVQLDTVIIKSIWTTGADSGTVTQASVAAPVLIVNEQASAFGAGWSLGGLQRIAFPSDTTMLLVTDGAGSITRFRRSCQGCLATALAADFSTLIRTVGPGGVVTGYRRAYRDGSSAIYNPAGYLTSTEDRFADSTKFAYNGSNQLQTIADPAGKTLTFVFVSGKLSTITDPNGRVSTFSVNASGDLASIKDPTNTYAFQGSYDAQHRLTQTTDRASNTWKYVYDFAGKLASDSTPSVTVDTTISGTGSLVTRRLGSKIVSLESGELIDPSSGKGSTTNPGTQVLSASVRAVTYGMPLETTTAHATRFALDRFLAPLQVEQDSLADTTFIARDANEHVTQSVERRKRKTVASGTSTFDGPRLTHATNALTGSSITYSYDTTYDLVKRVSGSTQTVQNYLNAAKSLIDSTRVGSNPDTTKDSVTAYSYDGHGRTTLVVDPKRDGTLRYPGASGFQNTDSAAFRSNDILHTLSRITRFRYDNWGRLVRTVNPNRDSVIIALDKLNRTDTIFAPGAMTVYAYDSLGRVLQLTDPKGQTYAYHYNALGWADVLTDAATGDPAANRKDSLEFTKTGAMRKHVNRRLQATVTKFDHLGRDSTVTLADGRVTTFAYDSAGLWAAVANGESIDTVRTDTAGLVQTQISNRGGSRYVVTATADANGLLRSRVFTMGTDPTSLQTISYGYDAEWRLDTLSVGTQRTFFGYNADGLMSFIKLTQHSGTTLDSMTFAVTGVHKQYSVKHSVSGLQVFNTGYTRDSLDHITQRTNFHGDTTWNYTYDKLGQVTSYSDLAYSDTVTCVADPRGQDGEVCTSHSVPTTVHSATFTYDSVGNRTDGSPTIIAGNRLTIWNGDTLTYDYDGNLTHKIAPGLIQYLYWNSVGQLDSVKTNGALTSFGYDGAGRRVRKTVGSAIYKYVYDGDQILAIDSLGTRVRTYSYYPGVDQPHSVITSAGNRYYYISEAGAGSVWGVIDTVGGIKNRYQYAPVGTSEVASELVANPFRFTGREYDPETQLYFYRSRYYDPSVARFTSEDPTEMAAGTNQYSYASNDPVNRNDPGGTNDGAPEYVGNPRCDRVFATDSNCSQGGNPSGGFDDMFTQGMTDLGYGTDFPTSWADWEARAIPADCGGFSTEYCYYVQHAVGQLQQSKDGAQCNALGDDASSRLKDDTMILGESTDIEGRSVEGAWWSPSAIAQSQIEPPSRAAYTHGLVTIAPNAFFSKDNLFVTIAHEEAHAVFGLPDQTDAEALKGMISPAEAVAQACLYYNNH